MKLGVISWSCRCLAGYGCGSSIALIRQCILFQGHAARHTRLVAGLSDVRHTAFGILLRALLYELTEAPEGSSQVTHSL
jgi:hypothetical protein